MSVTAAKAREIFTTAVEQYGPNQWPKYVAKACGDDLELRDRVQLLLDAHAGEESVLDRPAVVPTPTIDERLTEELGAQIGRYKLLQEIGEGGMGVVYMAEQKEPVKRRVALKIIRPGMDTRQVIARFEAERQALAMMDHPNIARVLDGGVTDQGRPYFAMEYVKGVPLIEYCDNAKLSVKARLELFIPICKAVQHAHQKGVIHRDLKPSNILVCLYDGKPVTKVIDFGLAKAMHQSLTDKTMYTAHGMMVGTPLYMSPEQAESNNLDVDTRTDIYSLGVILYELLTGSTPLEKAQLKDAAVNEILRLIKEVEPPKPSTRVSASQPNVAAQRSIDPEQLTRSVSGDLDWVVMKALEKERCRRYETANGLAEDIRRHLSDEPVSAGAPSAGYRMRKFIKRNRASVVAGSFVAAALLIAIVGTTSGMLWALNERADAERQRARAQRREEDAIEAVRRFGDAVANNAELKYRPELNSLRETLLREPLAYFKSLSQQLQQDTDSGPESSARLALAAFSLADLTREIGDKQHALTAFRQAQTIFEQLARDHPSVAEYQHELARSHHNIGTLLGKNGQPGEAVAEFQKALAIHERLVRDKPEVTDYRRDLAQHYNNIGNLLCKTGQRDEALKNRQQAMKIRKGLVHENPDDTEFQQELAGSHHNIGNLQVDFGETEKALKSYQQALAIRERLAQANQTVNEYQSDLASSHNAIGILLSKTGQPKKSLEAYQRALEILEHLVQENSTVTRYQQELAAQHVNIGALLHQIGQPHEAMVAYQQSLAIGKRLARVHRTVTDIHDDLASSHHRIGTMFFSTGTPEKALAAFRRALAIRERLVRENPTLTKYQQNLAGDHDWIGYVLSQTGQTNEALQAYQESLSIRERLVQENQTVPEYHSDLAAAHYDIGDLYSTTGQSKKALAAYQKALVIWDRLAGENPDIPGHQRDVATTQNDIGLLLKAMGRRQEGLEALQKALKIREDLAGSHPVVTAYQSELGGTLNNIAMMDVDAGRYSEGCTKLIRAIEHQKQALATNPNRPITRRFLRNHYTTSSYAAMGLAGAKRWKEGAVFGRQLIDQDPDDATIWLRVAPLLLLGGNEAFYSEFCQRMVSRFADTEDVAVAEKVCKACLLKQEAIDTAELPQGLLISQLDDGTAEDSFQPWGWTTRGLLAYRDGDAELAIRYANRSEECQPAVPAHALNLAVLALAQRQLRDGEAADRALTELSQIVDGEKHKIYNFHDLLIARILLREAERQLAQREHVHGSNGGT